MSLIVATYNSETKELSVTIDGASMDCVESVMIRSCKEMYDGEEECYGYCEVNCRETKENGVTYMNSARASKIEDNKVISDYFNKTLSKK